MPIRKVNKQYQILARMQKNRSFHSCVKPHGIATLEDGLQSLIELNIH